MSSRPVGGTAGQALEDGDPVTADAAEGLHDEGEDGEALVHGVTVVAPDLAGNVQKRK